MCYFSEKRLQGQLKPQQKAGFLLRRSLFSRVIFENRPQRYYFLRTQPNKMHKNDQNVHISVVLCNISSRIIWLLLV